MIFEHDGKRPQVHPTAWVAPNATISGDVTIGPMSRVLFGAVLTADGGPIRVGGHCVVMENAVLRGTSRHPLTIGEHVLVGPHAHLSGCEVASEVFLATRSTVFNGARVGWRAEVRVNATVHVDSAVPDGAVVPIGWVAVGNPARILPPGDHDQIWEIQESLDFPGVVFGAERTPDMMFDIMERYTRVLGRHADDKRLDS